MDAFEFFLSNLRAERTKKQYRMYGARFFHYINMNPDQVLELRKQDLTSDDLQRKLRFEKLARSFRDSLVEQGKGYSIRIASYVSVKGFFDFYDVELRLKRRDAPSGDHEKAVRACTKGEVRQLLAGSDLYGRAIVLFLKSTGLCAADAVKLRFKDLGDGSHSSWHDWMNHEAFLFLNSQEHG